MTRKPDGVSVVPLRLSPDVVVYLVTRRVGRHLDCEQAIDEITTIEQAVEYAARRWHVPMYRVTIEPEETINLGE